MIETASAKAASEDWTEEQDKRGPGSMNTVQGKISIARTPGDLYQAITDPAQLTAWFTEHADVALPDRWEVWGRYTPGHPDSPETRPCLIEARQDSQLNFNWHIFEQATTVDIVLEETGDGSTASVIHSGLDDPSSWLLEAYWSTSLENLRSWTEAGRTGLLIDFTAIGPGDVEISADIDASQETVFKALTDPRQLERYMCDSAFVEPEIGGRFDIGWEGEGPVKIVDFARNELVAYSWKVADQEDLTVVTWSLEGSGDKTRLTMVHTGFVPDRQAIDYNAGWLDYINRIKAMSETGKHWMRPQIHVEGRTPVSV